MQAQDAKLAAYGEDQMRDLIDRLLGCKVAICTEAAAQLLELKCYREMYEQALELLKAADAESGRDEALEWRDQQIKDLRKYLDDDNAEHKLRLTLIRDWLLTISVDGPSPRSKWETVKYTGLAAFLKDHPDAYEWLGPRALPRGRVWPD